MTRLRLGKVGLNKYLFKIDASDTNLCNHCNSGSVEDIHHHLLYCIAFSDERQKLRDDLRNLGVHMLDINILLGDSRFSPQIKRQINDLLARYIKNCKRLI